LKIWRRNVRHRLDDLENSDSWQGFVNDVRHRLDDLEITVFSVSNGNSVRHRLDDLKISLIFRLVIYEVCYSINGLRLLKRHSKNFYKQ